MFPEPISLYINHSLCFLVKSSVFISICYHFTTDIATDRHKNVVELVGSPQDSFGTGRASPLGSLGGGGSGLKAVRQSTESVSQPFKASIL